ncbi:hypothetical protein LT679_08015 [Mucilaginibacter roseus]|uniref:UDP-N-acetylglucosamine 2-epimerase domain-containing protein n=1 Tax=Mucilaginibacter roseus TaxID=1528868 RepID=A0ABS8U427_9SPHI|nr:hypothetical protein [Mucilaginibacter roseus]MCD8740544.1 hypothetical protein [Mucilaginibacter roseus]
MIIGKEYKDKFLPHWEKWKRVTFRGYNYGGIIANELSHLHHIDGEGKKFSLKAEFKSLLKNILYKSQNIPISITERTGKQSNNLIIGFVMDDDNRGDYLKQCDNVLNQLDDYTIRVFTIDKDFKVKRKFAFCAIVAKFSLIIKTLTAVPIRQSFRVQSVAKNIKLLAKCLYYYDLSRFIDSINLLENLNLLIVFSDMKQYGNIFVQSAKQKKILTATMQHGIYVRHRDHQYSQSAINYLNSPADYLLGWGDSVASVFNANGNSRKNVLLSGSSVKEYQISNYYTAANDSVMGRTNSFVILFSRSTLRQSNADMLRIAQTVAKQTGYMFNVLMHPTNKLEHYAFDKCSNLIEVYQNSSMLVSLIQSSDFCICHSTTVYFTSLLKRKACFRYNDEHFIDYGGLDDMFNNENELLNKITKNDYVLENENLEKLEALLEHQFGSREHTYKNSIETLLKQAVKIKSIL